MSSHRIHSSGLGNRRSPNQKNRKEESHGHGTSGVGSSRSIARGTYTTCLGSPGCLVCSMLYSSLVLGIFPSILLSSCLYYNQVKQLPKGVKVNKKKRKSKQKPRPGLRRSTSSERAKTRISGESRTKSRPDQAEEGCRLRARQRPKLSFSYSLFYPVGGVDKNETLEYIQLSLFLLHPLGSLGERETLGWLYPGETHTYPSDRLPV